MLQLSLWGQDPTPRQHLAQLCQPRRLCWGIALAGLGSLFLSGACRAPRLCPWTWLLPTPKDICSLFLCLADPELQLYFVSGQFPLVLYMYLIFFSLVFSEGFLGKNGSIFPTDFVHSHRPIDKWTFSAAWLLSLLSVPGPSPAKTSFNTLKKCFQVKCNCPGIFFFFWFCLLEPRLWL